MNRGKYEANLDEAKRLIALALDPGRRPTDVRLDLINATDMLRRAATVYGAGPATTGQDNAAA